MPLRGFIWSSTPTIVLEMKLDGSFFTSFLCLKGSEKLLQQGLKMILYSELFNH